MNSEATGVDYPLVAPAAHEQNSLSAIQPVRTCVGCRKRVSKTSLVRLVAVNGVCIVDIEGRLPGRGAYLHLRPDCLELALRKKAINRALRVVGPSGLDFERVREYFGTRQDNVAGIGLREPKHHRSSGMNAR